MIADAGDGVEIGDIEGRRGGMAQQAARDGEGVVGRAERTLDRTINGTVAGFGMDDGIALEIERRNNREFAHCSLSNTSGSCRAVTFMRLASH